MKYEKAEKPCCQECFWFSDITVQTCEHEHDPTTPDSTACDFFDPK